MGILNVTPDSFSDGGLYVDIKSAQQRALQMVDEGADIIDVGGESSRPGAAAISEAEEKQRVLPIIKLIRDQSTIPISVDTQKAAVAYEAMKEGANWINDISAASADPEMPAVMAETQAKVILMHMRGNPRTMQQQTHYTDIVSEVRDRLNERAEALEARGIGTIMLDPGLGFAKTATQNWALLRNLRAFTSGSRPIMIGASRKSFIQGILADKASNVLEGSLAIAAYSLLNGISALRVHDVRETVRVRTTLEAIQAAQL